MKKYPILLATCIATASLTSACHTQKAANTFDNSATPMRPRPAGGSMAIPSPPAVIYKTKRDYSQNVPVMMDDSRTRIVSYPAPSDVRIGERLATPDSLDNGYWLDNRGIGENVAFLSFTYEEYSNLKEVPSMETLMESIIDKDPLVRLVRCGRRSDYRGKNLVDEMNRYIRENHLE